MNDIYYNKYIKYKQKYLNLKDSNGFVQSDSLKQKYLSLKDGFVQSDSLVLPYINQYGGAKKTFLIDILFNINKKFIEEFKLKLIKKGWIESFDLPINFGLTYDKTLRKKLNEEYKNNNNQDKFKKTELINFIKGKTFDNIVFNNNLYIRKYKKEFFIHPFKELNLNNIKNIYKQYILDPDFSTPGDNIKHWIDNPRKLVSSKDQIISIIKQYPENKNWIIKDVLTEPCLKNGRAFSLNLVFIITVNPFQVYFYKKKLYNLASKFYDKDLMYEDPYIREPSPYYTYNRDLTFTENNKKKDLLFFPDSLPDNMKKNEALYVDEMINNIVPLLFKSKIEIETFFNSKNGYYIFNGIIQLYERLPPTMHGVFSDWYPFLQMDIIPGLISILIDNKDHPDFQKVNLKKKVKNYTKDNYQYARQYSYGRQIMQTQTNNTFYIKTDESDFDEEMSKELINKGYKKSTNYPVDFIFIQGEASYYRSRFNSEGSSWISLLYGDSKSEISNKIFLHKKYEKLDFIINAQYINSNAKVEDIIIENKIKILKPLNGFEGRGITIVKTKDEVIKWLNENKKYKEWILEDYIMDPNLKDGYKFHFRVIILIKVVKNKKPEVFISNYKYYVKALEKYKKSDWLNKDIHDTHYKPGKIITFPEEIPDNWNEDDVNKSINEMHDIIKMIFNNQTDFVPEWNAINGFELFGADFMFENKKPYLLEINAKMSLKGRASIITGVIETVLENNKNKYFTKLL